MSADRYEPRSRIEGLLVYAQDEMKLSLRIQCPNDKDFVIRKLCNFVLKIHEYHEARRIEFVSSFHSAHESYLGLNAL